MNPKLAHLLVCLYPRPWRDRYGAEFEALLQTGRGDLGASANVVWSALGERVFPTPGLNIGQHRFQSWCVRAPGAMFGLAPLFLLAGAYFVACFYLWCGWRVFLPGADTPFAVQADPAYGLSDIYFQAGKYYYFAAPILVGWAIGIIAARQRLKAVWPVVGMVVTAWMGGTAQIHAGLTATPGGLGHISMHFFTIGPSRQTISGGLLHALVILSFTVLPYLIWRLQEAHSLSAQPPIRIRDF
jgi:hypothetical protein